MWGTKRRIQNFKVEKTMKIFRNHENASRRHGRSRDSGWEGFGPDSVFQRQENLHIVPSKTTEPSTRWCMIFVTIISSSWKWNVVQLSKFAFYQLTFHHVDDLHILEDLPIHILSLHSTDPRASSNVSSGSFGRCRPISGKINSKATRLNCIQF